MAVEHTFSNPKNLSLPSFRTGPAFCSIFCNGVISGSGSASFLPDLGEDTPGLVAPYSIAPGQWMLRLHAWQLEIPNNSCQSIQTRKRTQSDENIYLQTILPWSYWGTQTLYQSFDLLGESDTLFNPLCVATLATQLQLVEAWLLNMRKTSCPISKPSKRLLYVRKVSKFKTGPRTRKSSQRKGAA